jgi:hypothetical protein
MIRGTLTLSSKKLLLLPDTVFPNHITVIRGIDNDPAVQIFSALSKQIKSLSYPAVQGIDLAIIGGTAPEELSFPPWGDPYRFLPATRVNGPEKGAQRAPCFQEDLPGAYSTGDSLLW